MLLTVLTAAVLQDSPVAIPKADLPKEAECAICALTGLDHGKEKVAAGFRYKGATYFLCNEKEVATFKADPEGYAPPVLPRPAPRFDLVDLAGKAWNAASFEKGLILVDFWATWCKPCRELKPIVDKVHGSYHSRGLEVLSVSIDEKRLDLDKFLQKNKFTNPVLHDTKETWDAWKVKVIPMTFLVKDGMIVAQWRGKFKEASLREAIDRAITAGRD